MATIKIQRTAEYNNRLRDYKIFIDGQNVGTIANGETKEFETNAAQHTITAKIDWCSSQDISIEVKENQTKILKVSGYKYGRFITPISIVIIVLHFILSKLTGIGYFIYLVAPLLFVHVYYMSIGRKKYLTLAEKNDI
jgi:hypothetical protein